MSVDDPCRSDQRYAPYAMRDKGHRNNHWLAGSGIRSMESEAAKGKSGSSLEEVNDW